MKRVQFAAAYPERLVHPLHRRVIEPGPVTRAELLTWSPTADATTLFWCDADADATASVVRVVDSLVEKELVEDGDGTYAFLDRTATTSSRRRCLTRSRPHTWSFSAGRSSFWTRATCGSRRSGAAAALGAFHEALTDLARRCHRAGPRVGADVAVAAHRSAARRVGGGSRGGGYYEIPATGPSKTSPRPSTARRARPANWCGRPRQR